MFQRYQRLLRVCTFFFFSGLSLFVSGRDYFVSSSDGDDVNNNGTSSITPWKSVTKVNTEFTTFLPGDRILFKRGDTFYGTLTITKSGLPDYPITIGAYGAGNNPIISGFTNLTTWDFKGNNIYSSRISLESSKYIIVSVEGVNIPIGRYPNIGSPWLTIDSYFESTSLTDAALDAKITNWSGAEAVVRKNEFTLERLPIISHVNNTLNFKASGFPFKKGYGYFIQNDLRTLDAINEWFYDGAEFYIYGNPTTKIVEVSAYINAVIIKSVDYITIENLKITGFGGNGINLTDASNITIQDCSISLCGENGINGKNIPGGNSPNCKIDNNSFSNINNNGISCADSYSVPSQFSNIIISNNTFTDIGTILGAAHFTFNSDANYEGIKYFVGLTNTKSIIEYNTLNNVGYCGIHANGNNINIQYNFIDNFGLILSDGGGIYTYAELHNINETSKILIHHNIVLNGIGDGESEALKYMNGIFVDGFSRGVTTQFNTAAFCSGSNFYCNGNRDGLIRDNTFFNAVKNTEASRNDNFQINLFDDTFDIHENLKIKNNISFCLDIDERAFFFSSKTSGFLSKTVILDSNYYVRPLRDDFTILVNTPSGGSEFYNLAGWQSLSGQDLNSRKSPITVTDISNIRFEYNASKTNKAVTLEKPMTDVKGAKYQNIIILAPYTSAVLIVDPKPEKPLIPEYIGSVIENATPDKLEIKYNLTLANIVPPASAFSVKVNSVDNNISSVAISGSRVLLTLATPVVYGDIVTVSYIKPSINLIQTAAGAEAMSLTNQSVTNNCTPLTNKPPEIYISSPDKGSKYIAPATIVIDISASDPDGKISKIEVFNGTVKIGEITSVPYTFTWKNVPAGIYSITAIATDNFNATSSPASLVLYATLSYDSDIIDLYPNPNDGSFTASMQNALLADKNFVSVVSESGQTVYRDIILREENLRNYDLSYLRPGIYLMMIASDRIILTKKFVRK